MAGQIVKGQAKLFTNQLLASARQWQQIQDSRFQISNSLTFGTVRSGCDGGSCDSKIKQNAKNCVILMSLNVNQAGGRDSGAAGTASGHAEVGRAAAEMVQSLWQLCHRSGRVGSGRGRCETLRARPLTFQTTNLSWPKELLLLLQRKSKSEQRGYILN